MRKLGRCSMAFLTSIAAAGVASAQSDQPWDGFYVGLGAGEASHSACSSWTLNGAAAEPVTGTTFYNQSCPGGSTLLGGVQVGENFQYQHLFWGVGADVD